MVASGTNDSKKEYESLISEIIQSALVDLYGAKGYKSIMGTMMNVCGKSGKEIVTNYELFTELIEGIFGRLGDLKILDPIKFEINKMGLENIKQEEKEVSEKLVKIMEILKNHNY